MRNAPIKAILLATCLCLLLATITSCGGGDSSTGDMSGDGPVVITIGNHTDLTQAPSNAIAEINLPLEDVVRYYNERELIPGVQFQIITYDNRYNPGNAVAGYQWLKQQGADFIFSPTPEVAVTLKPYLEQDEMVLFTSAPLTEAVEPPGWVFGAGSATVEAAVYTLLDWVATNDPDFPQDRPARIGGAVWDEAYGRAMLGAAETYCDANPDRYDWVFGETTEWTFSWEPQVQALKDCDYVFPNTVLTAFVQQYRAAGGTAKFLGTDVYLLFLDQIRAADVWDEIDGMLFIGTNLWWNTDQDFILLLKDLLREYRPEKADQIMQETVAYLVAHHIEIMLSVVEEAVKAVGAENLDSRAIYDTALAFSMDLQGCPHSFSETKRTSSDALSLTEAVGDAEDLQMVGGWIPVVREP